MTAIPSACKQTSAGLHVAAAGAATSDGRVMTLARYLLDSLRALWLSPYPAASLNKSKGMWRDAFRRQPQEVEVGR